MPDMILSLEMLQCTCQKRPMPLWNLQSRCLDKWANEDMWLFQRVMSKCPYHGRHLMGWCGDTCLRRWHLKENQNEEMQPNIGWSEEGTQGLARAKARRRMRKVRVAGTERGQERERQNIDWRNTGAMSGGILEAILQTSELILSAQEATERLPWALTLSEMWLCEEWHKKQKWGAWIEAHCRLQDERWRWAGPVNQQWAVDMWSNAGYIWEIKRQNLLMDWR